MPKQALKEGEEIKPVWQAPKDFGQDQTKQSLNVVPVKDAVTKSAQASQEDTLQGGMKFMFSGFSYLGAGAAKHCKEVKPEDLILVGALDAMNRARIKAGETV